MWLAGLSFYLGTWVIIVVVYHDQLCFGKPGSVPKFENGPNSYSKANDTSPTDMVLR